MRKETAIFIGASKPHTYIECRFAGYVGVQLPCRLEKKSQIFLGCDMPGYPLWPWNASFFFRCVHETQQ
jgi:hypothetical protein